MEEIEKLICNKMKFLNLAEGDLQKRLITVNLSDVEENKRDGIVS